MIKKIYIQVFLLILLVFISLFVFLKYFKTESKNNFKLNMEQTTNNESLIEDLKYLSTDKEGNEYKIEAKKRQYR